jgi:hypothetical protein
MIYLPSAQLHKMCSPIVPRMNDKIKKNFYAFSSRFILFLNKQNNHTTYSIVSPIQTYHI